MTAGALRMWRRPAVITMLLGVLSLPVQADPADSVLAVQAVGGSVTVEHLGVSTALKPGDRLKERDVIRTGLGGRLALRFARLGFFELGPDAEIGVEKLPFASYATDRNSIISLSRGYLRVVWKHLPTSTAWPIYVYFGRHRAGLGPGEYFFDQRDSVTRICIAAGEANAVAVTGEKLELLQPPSCTQLSAGVPPASRPRDPEDWFAVRRDYSLDANAKSQPLPAPPMLGLSPPAPLATAQAESSTATVTASTRWPLIDLLAVDALLRGATAATPAPPLMQTAPGSGPAPAAAKPPVAEAPVTPTSARPVTAAVDPATASADGEGPWIVNIASYPDLGDATRQVQQLQAAGYSASQQSVQIRGQSWHRVQLRGFATAEAARVKAAEVEQKLGLHNLWVMRQQL